MQMLKMTKEILILNAGQHSSLIWKMHACSCQINTNQTMEITSKCVNTSVLIISKVINDGYDINYKTVLINKYNVETAIFMRRIVLQ